MSADLTLTLSRDDNGTLLVRIREFPEVVTFGKDLKEALQNVSAAIEEVLAARRHKGEEVPPLFA